MASGGALGGNGDGGNGDGEVARLAKGPGAPAPTETPAQEAPPATGSKRRLKIKRMSLSLREKAVVKSFCEQRVNESKARGELVPSQELLRREVASQLGWNCGRSTLSKILALDWRALRGGHEGGDAPRNTNMKRRHRPLFPAFEADLVKFIAAHLDHGDVTGASEVPTSAVSTSTSPPSPPDLSVEASTALATPSTVAATSDGDKGHFARATTHEESRIESETAGDRAVHVGGRARVLTEALILEEAQRLKQVHGVTDEELVLSVGWLARFKHRNGIRLRKPAGGGKSPQSLEAIATAASPPMGIWSTNLGVPALTPTATSGAISGQISSTTVTSGASTDSQPPAVQPSNQQHASASEIGALKRSLVCGAQWQQSLALKDDSAWMRLLMQLPEQIRALACPCQAKAVEKQLPLGIAGLRVVVLGAGSIVEAFLAAALVGPGGLVTCLETSADNIALAVRAAVSYCVGTLGLPAVNMRFILHAEMGSSTPFSSSPSANDELKELRGRADFVVFNCSFQSLETVTDKRTALELAFRLLKVGGELRVTDVGCSRRISSSERDQARAALTDELGAGTVVGQSEKANTHLERLLLLVALYVGDLQRLCRALGSNVDVRSVGYNAARTCVLATSISEGGAQFHRVTFRVFRIEDVEVPCEDYGQTAVYNGGDLSWSSLASGDSTPAPYRLDDNYSFPRGERVPVDGNTAQILQTSWLRRLFSVGGDRSKHRGAFFVLKRPEIQETVSFQPSQASQPMGYPASTMDHTVASGQSSPAQRPDSTGSAMEPLEMADI